MMELCGRKFNNWEMFHKIYMLKIISGYCSVCVSFLWFLVYIPPRKQKSALVVLAVLVNLALTGAA